MFNSKLYLQYSCFHFHYLSLDSEYLYTANRYAGCQSSLLVPLKHHRLHKMFPSKHHRLHFYNLYFLFSHFVLFHFSVLLNYTLYIMLFYLFLQVDWQKKTYDEQNESSFYIDIDIAIAIASKSLSWLWFFCLFVSFKVLPALPSRDRP